MEKDFNEALEELYQSSDIGSCIVAVILAIILLIGLCCLEIALATWLWNTIIVATFGLPALSFWELLGLNILLSILIPHNTINNKKEN